MKDPINGELLIVGDGSQGLYGRRKISWKQWAYRRRDVLELGTELS